MVDGTEKSGLGFQKRSSELYFGFSSAPAPVREATHQVIVCHVWSGTEKSHDQPLGEKSSSFELIGVSDKQLIQIGMYC